MKNDLLVELTEAVALSSEVQSNNLLLIKHLTKIVTVLDCKMLTLYQRLRVMESMINGHSGGDK